ncbi:hypothetical protein [Cryptosporangium minutisporangium]|uniref:DUF2567 domain-containing protein n=1 Tax=Cryptosporangium minutisporangium TaxID=113569 RepID=A0ABP6SP57_9ACTN
MSRLRTAWRAAHTPVHDAPGWAVLAAYAIPICVLPAGLWRIGAIAFRQSAGPGEAIYVAFLSVVSELVAFTAVGLVARWGEVVPGWVPGLRGRRIPPWVPTLAAAAGASALTALWTAAAVAVVRNRSITGGALADPSAVPWAADDLHSYLFAACYAPLVLWGPLLGAVTVAYWARRRADGDPL